MSQNFSPIQNHILSKLKNAENLRYSELMPEKVPNDLFNYHLQFLVKKGFVKKSDDGYSLDEAGVKHVADPEIGTKAKIASLFKVNVITIVSRKNGGKIEILNQRRTSHPSFGKIGVMGGIVRKEEIITAAAKRKLEVETGLTAEFRHVGMERRVMYKKGKFFSDVFFPITYASESTGTLRNTEFGENFWTPIDGAIKNESDKNDSIAGIRKVLEEIKAGTINSLPFFFEETFQNNQK